MDDGILGVIILRPDGIERQRRSEGTAEGEGCAILSLRPVVKGIAGTGRVVGRRTGRFVALYERGRDIGAALRIKGDPVTLFDNSRQGNIVARHDKGIFNKSIAVLPADDRIFIADGIGHLCSDNLIACMPLLRDHDFALLIGEEDEVHVREAGIIGERLRFGNGHLVAKGSELVAAFLGIIPTNKLLILVVRFRRAGVVEGFAVLDDLAGELRIAVHENIGVRVDRRLHDAFQRKAFTGLRAAGDGHDGRQRVHGRAADEHDQRHQQGKTPTKLVFHKKLILPMKFR